MIQGEMGVIAKLAEEVINQIAAGEVVERPVSVVKELVDNALDAGASYVSVYIEQGGKRLIRVVDDGSGLAKSDLSSAVQRHYTSKITSIDDLTSLTSLGFRGEALSSIASVSDFTMKSRTKDDDSGWQVSVHQGVSDDPKPAGMAIGTDVVVENLFSKVPARKNFLKSDATELGHITELVHQYALVYPQVGFKLINNGKETFVSSKGQSIEQLLGAILGTELATKMVPLEADHPQLSVTGWVGRPGTGVSHRPQQYVFVNGRPVEESTVRSAVYQGYGSLLGRHEKPQFIIKIQIVPHLVDFNVHPQKKEVRFVGSGLVFQLVQQAVGKAVSGFSFLPHVEIDPNPFAEKPFREASNPRPSFSSGSVQSGGNSFGGLSAGVPAGLSGGYDQPLLATQNRIVTTATDWGAVVKSGKVFQILNLFIVEEIDDGIIVYDQHAVHERVLYERFVQAYLGEKEAIATQALLVPARIDLSPKEVEFLKESLEFFQELGFGISVDDKGVLVVVRVPAIVADVNLSELLKEYLGDLEASIYEEASPVKAIDDQTHRRLATLACRSAVKAGDPMRESEIIELLRDYRATKINSTCPHGRPVQVVFTRSEMEKWFKRT